MEFKQLQKDASKVFINNLKRDKIDLNDDYLVHKISEELGEFVQSYIVYKKRCRPEKYLPPAKAKKELAKDKKNPALIARSYALKTVANASYGYMGFFAARWYSREAAEAITAYGRDYIMKTIEKAKKEFEIVYGDSLPPDRKIFIQDKNKKTLKVFYRTDILIQGFPERRTEEEPEEEEPGTEADVTATESIIMEEIIH